MNLTLQLRKGVIKESIGQLEYAVQDVFNQEIINMTLSRTMIMGHPDLSIGDEVYVIVSPFDPKRGRIAIASSLKQINDLYQQKLELDSKYRDMKKINQVFY
ncbi:MAG: hypothetical protein P1U56_19655 [Saprospiraceae bacterium]|nr:hypothetical protein [Saprospiraceae bacterium]